ncbi:putative F-box protein involved in pathogenicity [Venustampulla echinocandica]|uniref:Putative F-box protein involved in pathogenicity n=1 Tax=Venustampulla echinocandica TaxID=2656787 RepID=A0A370U2Y3_9HELO|nr:putative F-box protein involved in pathogenicity [Venustampulla echinocandica]RDL42125.1 putative F-box protein involved in pathogenicity [Venustampulla echinocandica]
MDPLHITEFASERYFDKLKQLNRNAEQPAAAGPATQNAPEQLPAPLQASTFILPLGRQRQINSEHALALRPSEQKKRSLGHDLTALRTQRRPSFVGGFGSLRSKVTTVHKIPSVLEQQEEILAEDPTAALNFTLSDLFLSLPSELQAQIIAPLPIHDVLNLRLVSKTFHTLVALNESPIARYHIAHSLPAYTLRLYPVPEPQNINLHYVCGIWHRLHVALKLSTMISSQATKEIFLRTTEVQRLEFEPQHQRMRQRLMPLVFTLFHFFETYRELHVRHLTYGGTPLRLQPYTLNPIECEVMAMYDDQTLLRAHQVFPLVMSSFSRRLRPPSYAGRIERSFKGYLKDRPADEVYATIIQVGGLRQAQRFWETKGYNIRRAAVDTWYGFVTRSPVEAPPKSKLSMIASLGRKKPTPAVDVASAEGGGGHAAESCREWFCVKPACLAARRRHSTDNLVFHSSLAAGPPMSPLTREQLRVFLPDLQHLSNIWMQTAEALILERKIVPAARDIKRNHVVLLELIREREGGADGMEDWASRNTPPAPTPNLNIGQQEGMGSSGGVSD